MDNSAKNTAIIYSIGHTHRLYINVPENEADRRWQIVCDSMSSAELQLHAERGERVERSVVAFTDEIEIWSDAGRDMSQIAQMLLGGLRRS